MVTKTTTKKKKEPKYRTLGEALEAARLDAGMNLRMASEALVDGDVIKTPDYTSISRWERGVRVPRFAIFIGMCRAYGVRPSEVLKKCGLDEIEYTLSDILAERGDWVEEEEDPGCEDYRQCTTYIPDSLREDCGDLAYSRGLSFSELVRNLLGTEMAKHRRRQERRMLG